MSGLTERFWLKVDQRGPDECWPWLASADPDGRGRFWWPDAGRNVAAPRVVWYLSTGLWPGDLFVCHHCDNPPCVNPAHLFLGTASDNARDMDSKGRRVTNPLKGLANPKAKTPPEIVQRAVADYLAGHTCKEVGARYGVAATTVSSWVLAKTRAEDAALTPRSRPLSPCGTRAAAVRHRAYGEPVCDACKAGEAAYKATLKARRTVV